MDVIRIKVQPLSDMGRGGGGGGGGGGGVVQGMRVLKMFAFTFLVMYEQDINPT